MLQTGAFLASPRRHCWLLVTTRSSVICCLHSLSQGNWWSHRCKLQEATSPIWRIHPCVPSPTVGTRQICARGTPESLSQEAFLNLSVGELPLVMTVDYGLRTTLLQVSQVFGVQDYPVPLGPHSLMESLPLPTSWPTFIPCHQKIPPDSAIDTFSIAVLQRL